MQKRYFHNQVIDVRTIRVKPDKKSALSSTVFLNWPKNQLMPITGKGKTKRQDDSDYRIRHWYTVPNTVLQELQIQQATVLVLTEIRRISINKKITLLELH